MASEKNEVIQNEYPVHEHHHEAPTSIKLHHDQVAPEALGGLQQDLPKNYYWSPKFLGTLVATCLAQISGYLGWVLPANTISLIIAELGVSSSAIWIAVAWQIGFAVGLLMVGRLSDIFGRRWFFTGSSILAIIANVIAATAFSVDQLVAANCINGIAAAGQLSFSVVLGELVPNKQRGLFNALVLSTSVPFAVFGPPIARAFFEHTSLTFRWNYILGVIVNSIAVTLYFFFYHPPTYELLHVNGKSRLRQLKTFDWLGTALFTGGLTIFLIGLNWSESLYKWHDAHVLGAFFAGIAILVIFCFWEAYCGLDYPIMPMKLFRNFKYDAIVACASIGAMVYYSGTVIWPTMCGALFTTSVTKIGWLSCAVGGGLLCGQIAGGFGVRYLPKMKWQMTTAGVVMMAFVAALASANPSAETRTVIFLLFGTAGAGYVENLTLSTMALVWEPDDIGLVAGVLGAIRTAAGAIAVSMYSSILTGELPKYIKKDVVPAVLEAGLPESSLVKLLGGISTGVFTGVPGATPKVLAALGTSLKQAYSHAFRTVFLCTLPFGVILLTVAIIWCPNVEDYLTDEVARKLQGVAGTEKAPKDDIESHA